MGNTYYIIPVGSLNSPHIDKLLGEAADQPLSSDKALAWCKTPLGSTDTLPFPSFTRAEMIKEKEKPFWQPEI